MYICLCRGVSDKTIQAAISEGCSSVAEVRDKTGAATQCCKCVAEIKEMLAQEKEANPGQFYAVGRAI